MKIEQRILIYIGIVAAIIFLSFFWGSPGQSRNMRQARKEIEQLNLLINGDERFANIEFLNPTSNLGKMIFITGTVPDQNSLDVLKVLIQNNISAKYKLVYNVEIKDKPKDPHIKAEPNKIRD